MPYQSFKKSKDNLKNNMLKTKPRGKPTPQQKPSRQKQPKRQTAPAPAPKSRALMVPPKRDKTMSTKVIDFAADSHMGMEGMSTADFAIPRLAILQSLSPQVNARDEKYIEGA